MQNRFLIRTKAKHGVPGIVDSLDCAHITWHMCPASWKGSYQGCSGHPTVVIKALVDNTLKIWHMSLLVPGTSNNLNIWHSSVFYVEFLNRYFLSDVNFEFVIGGKLFDRVFILTDGIYLLLERFIKSLLDGDALFNAWQEGIRKAVEQAFGTTKKVQHNEVWVLWPQPC